MATDRKMKVIPKPAPSTDAAIAEITVAPFIDGGDPDGYDYVCGSCAIPLLQHMGTATTFQGVIIKCPRCGEYNVT